MALVVYNSIRKMHLTCRRHPCSLNYSSSRCDVVSECGGEIRRPPGRWKMALQDVIYVYVELERVELDSRSATEFRLIRRCVMKL